MPPPSEKIQIQVDEEHIKRTGQCSPEDALAELIWNSLDAGSTEIQVSVRRNNLTGIASIQIDDNGSGIESYNIESAFGNLGHSAKPQMKLNPRGKPLHGRLGEGRFKAYRLGTKVEWITRVKEGTSVSISGDYSSIGHFLRTESSSLLPNPSGTRFIAHNGYGAELDLPSDETLANHLAISFAPNLLADAELRICVGDYLLNPIPFIAHDKKEELVPSFPGSFVRTVVWKKGQIHEMHWCDSNFISRRHEDIELDVQVPYSVFVGSPLIEQAVRDNTLTTPELSGLLQLKEDAVGRAKKQLEEISKITIEKTIARLKATHVYPYEGEARSSLEKLERSVFDVCTTKIIRSIPAIEKANHDSQKLTLHLLRQAIETSPTALHDVLQKVLKLPQQEVETLSELLKQVTFSGLIRLGKTVTDRLSFVSGFEQLVLDDRWRKHVQERRQLHKILEQQTWIFGEQFALGNSDESLNRVLKKHLDVLKHGKDAIKGNPKLAKEMAKIPDLVLGRQFVSGAGDRYEHLVIELKRPSVKVGFSEKLQIEKYASTVSREPNFDKHKTKWVFFVISTEVEEGIKPSLEQRDRYPGQIQVTKNYEIWVKTWGELLQEAKGRMDYLKSKLELQSSKDAGLSYIKKSFPEIMETCEVSARSKSSIHKKSQEGRL